MVDVLEGTSTWTPPRSTAAVATELTEAVGSSSSKNPCLFIAADEKNIKVRPKQVDVRY